MKKFFIEFFIILSVFTFALFAQTGGESNGQVKTAEEIMQNFENSEVEESQETEEFELPKDRKQIKNVIKADLGIPLSQGLFTVYKLLPTDMIRIPLFYEYAFIEYLSLQLSIEEISVFIIPTAFGANAGLAIYPLGKAPYDLFISLRAGGAFGLFYALSLEASLGWQFIFKNDFVLSIGADFAYYFETTNEQFYMPTVSLAFGWGF
ncbi:MAG: hypothetical protein K5839_02025 [Treponemataceae bacterium]|nr:hypothetical protein [Treponemataceae bacterium]